VYKNAGKKKSKWLPSWRFAMLPIEMLDSPEWKALTPGAKLIYTYFKKKFNPDINGKIRLYHSELQEVRGLKNSRTRCRAFKELEKKGWIVRTTRGGLFRHFNDYTITGKFDPSIAWLSALRGK
jgi:hypothetical protein